MGHSKSTSPTSPPARKKPKPSLSDSPNVRPRYIPLGHPGILSGQVAQQLWLQESLKESLSVQDLPCMPPDPMPPRMAMTQQARQQLLQHQLQQHQQQHVTPLTPSHSIVYDGSRRYQNDTSVTAFVVAETVATIGMHAFSNSGVIAVAELPAVDTILLAAFLGCKKLETANLVGVKSIGGLVFQDCPLLGSVFLTSDVCYVKEGLLRSFDAGCLVLGEPHLRATFLLCLMSDRDSTLGRVEGRAMLGSLDLQLARKNFDNSGQCVGVWRKILTYV